MHMHLTERRFGLPAKNPGSRRLCRFMTAGLDLRQGAVTTQQSMKKIFLSLCLALAAGPAALADTITLGGSSSTSTTTYAATNSVFTYYGFPVTNYPAAGGAVSSYGINNASEMAKFPPVQVSFDLTGTNFWLMIDNRDYVNGTTYVGSGQTTAYFTVTDGTTITAYTNVPQIGEGAAVPTSVLVSFANNTTHHVTVALKGNFAGVKVPAGATLSKTVVSTKPNLLIVLGDSFTEGYNAAANVYGWPSYWFDGWVWQLARLVPNTVAVPSGIGGTGFFAGGTNANYTARVVSDVCALYTNAVNSGKYSQIFITASGTINDRGDFNNGLSIPDQGVLYTNALYVYSTIKSACPQARLFFVGNWYGIGGSSSPGFPDRVNDSILSNVAVQVSIPYFSPSRSSSALLTAANYDAYYAGGDNIHPNAWGYSLLANWVNTNLTATFGTNWNSGSTNGTGVIYYSLAVNDGTGSGYYPSGQQVPIAAKTKLGYAFANWSGPGVANAGSSSTYVTLPASNIVVTANYVSSDVPTNFNVLNFGASGDLVKLTVRTASNSPVVSVIGTNRFSAADIGKVIQVFRAGPWITYSNWGPVVTNQDIICTITNVSNGTNLWLSIPCGWNMDAYATVGKNNAPAFQAAIDAAANVISNGTVNKVIVTVPAGAYMIVSPYVLDAKYVMNGISDTHPALTISTGGITFQGDSATNTVLMGCGAGMNHLVANFNFGPGYAPYVPMRDTLIFCYGPIRRSELPLIFQNLTFDGGLTNGLQNYRYYTIIQGNGEGWDTTHHCLADSNPFPGTPQMHQLKMFTNCVFQHWRGEVLICWTAKGGTNTFNTIANCVFRDGNGSAINLYYGQHVHDCLFDGFDKVEEYYQYNASLPSVFENNVWTNILGNPFSIVGSTTNENPQSFTFRNNIMYGGGGGNQIHFAPAENVTIVSNIFYGTTTAIAFSGNGVQPSDGSATIISNVVIACNQFNMGYDNTAITMDGYPVSTVLITNNTGTSKVFISVNGGWKTNIVLKGNSGGWVDASGIQSGSYLIDDPSNQFGSLLWDNGRYGNPAVISYGNGRLHSIASASAVFLLDDTRPDLTPRGATLTITNQDSATATVYGSHKVYKSTGSSPRILLPPGQSRDYLWTNGFWRVINPPLNPPAGL